MKRKIDDFRPFHFSPEFATDANRGQSVSMQQQDLLAVIAETREATARLVGADTAANARADLERINRQLHSALAAILTLAEQLKSPHINEELSDQARSSLGQIASKLVDGQNDLFDQIASLHQSETNLPEAGRLKV